ncbi:MAG: GFA family protein [Deltaproteobacteria bacterium]|nr:GFA family protein [Deltaproteobacteria bacterium]
MAESFTGGCACGAIRYECTAEPMFMWICHCRDCQRSTGGGGGYNVVFAKPAVKFTKNEPKYFVLTGTSGKSTYRGFCPDCGSPVAVKADLIPEIQGISAASLDEPSKVELIANIWTASAQPWDYLSPTLPQFAGTPTEDELTELVRQAHKS